MEGKGEVWSGRVKVWRKGEIWRERHPTPQIQVHTHNISDTLPVRKDVNNGLGMRALFH